MNFPAREGRLEKNYSGICCPLWVQPLPPFLKHALSRSITNRFLIISKIMLKNATPSWGCPTPHIFKYCQLLAISDNNIIKWISMKFWGIIVLARGRKMSEKIPKYVAPPGAYPAAPTTPILKHALAQPITNCFLHNFQKLVSQLGGKE